MQDPVNVKMSFIDDALEIRVLCEMLNIVSDIAIFVLKRDVKLQLTEMLNN